MDVFNAIIGIIGTILGGILSYAAFRSSSKKDNKNEGKEAGTILTEIGYIKANTEEIKTEQKEQRRTNVELVSRLAAVESSTKSAHKRLDRLEGGKPDEDAAHSRP